MRKLVMIFSVIAFVFAISGLGQATTLTVWPADNIQDAVDIASDGDVIYILGAHEEQVNIIEKNITLIGIEDATVIAPEFMYPNIDNNRAIIYVEDSNVKIKMLTIDGAFRGNSNYQFYGIYYRDADGRIDNCVVKDVRNEPFSGAQHGLGIYAYNTSDAIKKVFITNNVISGFQKNGITVNGNWEHDYSSEDPAIPTYTNIRAHVNDNIIVGAGTTVTIAQNGIQISRGASGDVKDNTISDLAYLGDGWASTGILAYYAYRVMIQGNTISDCDPAIYIAANDGTKVVRNILETKSSEIEDLDPWALLLSGDDIKVVNNRFKNFYVGIYIGSQYYGDTNNTKVITNRFSDVDYKVYESTSGGVEGTKERATKEY